MRCAGSLVRKVPQQSQHQNLTTMKIQDAATSPRPQLIEARPEDQQTLANLLELYIHDFSEFHAVSIGLDGRFGYPKLPLYWSEPGRHAFLIKVDGNIAGFVLVERGSQVSGSASSWEIAEFFVLRGYRRRGIGSEIAQAVWRRFPGSWEIRVMRSNGAAFQFWERAINDFTGEAQRSSRVGQNGKLWDVFSFIAEAQHKRDQAQLP